MSTNLIVGVTGKRGHGKSEWVRRHLISDNRLLIADALGEHRDWTTSLDCDLPEQLSIIAAQGKNAFRLACPLPIDDEEKLIAIDYLCRAAYLAARFAEAPVTLVIEECDHRAASTANWTNPGLNLLIQYGRHGPVNVVWTARYMGAVSRRLTSETDIHILFAVHEPRWLEAIADRLGEQAAEEASKLKRYHYLKIIPAQSLIIGVNADGKETWRQTLGFVETAQPSSEERLEDETGESEETQPNGKEGLEDETSESEETES